MPKLSAHQSSQITKLLLIGDSGSGKSGSLASLAAAGYKLRILDVDNGIDVLSSYLKDSRSKYLATNPEAMENVYYETLTDPMKNVNGRLVPAKANTWKRAVELLANWKVPGDDGYDLGKPAEWGPECILVIDSLSMLATAAMNYHLFLNAALGASRTQNEIRRDIGAAQNMIRDLLTLLYDVNFNTNVIVTSHITFVTETGGKPGADDQAAFGQGYPSALGRALSPHIPRWFNSMLIAKTEGSGASAKHFIYTTSQNVGGQTVNAKSSAPLQVLPKYPLETGLADYFKAIRQGAA